MWNVNNKILIKRNMADKSFILTMWNVNNLDLFMVMFAQLGFYLNYVECNFI